MRLTEIDGDILVSDVLRSELEAGPPAQVGGVPAPVAVYVGEVLVGGLRGFTLTSTTIDVVCVSLIDPLELLTVPTGSPLRIEGAQLSKDYIVREITCNLDDKSCSLKSILKF